MLKRLSTLLIVMATIALLGMILAMRSAVKEEMLSLCTSQQWSCVFRQKLTSFSIQAKKTLFGADVILAGEGYYFPFTSVTPLDMSVQLSVPAFDEKPLATGVLHFGEDTGKRIVLAPTQRIHKRLARQQITVDGMKWIVSPDALTITLARVQSPFLQFAKPSMLKFGIGHPSEQYYTVSLIVDKLLVPAIMREPHQLRLKATLHPTVQAPDTKRLLAQMAAIQLPQKILSPDLFAQLKNTLPPMAFDLAVQTHVDPLMTNNALQFVHTEQEERLVIGHEQVVQSGARALFGLAVDTSIPSVVLSLKGDRRLLQQRLREMLTPLLLILPQCIDISRLSDRALDTLKNIVRMNTHPLVIDSIMNEMLDLLSAHNPTSAADYDYQAAIEYRMKDDRVILNQKDDYPAKQFGQKLAQRNNMLYDQLMPPSST